MSTKQKGPRDDKFHPVKKGWLSKRGHIAKNWKRRWFILDESRVLYYFKDEVSDNDTTTEPAGVIELVGSYVDEIDHAERQHCFVITVQKKQWVIAPDKTTDRADWVDILREHGCLASPAGTNGSINWLDNPTKEGWLTKQGHKVKNWKRRYFVLKGTSLAYFKAQPTPGSIGTPAGVIAISHSTVEETEVDEKDKIFCFVIRSSSENKDYYISCESAKERYEWMLYLDSMKMGTADE